MLVVVGGLHDVVCAQKRRLAFYFVVFDFDGEREFFFFVFGEEFCHAIGKIR